MKKPKPFMTGIRFPSTVYQQMVKKEWGRELIFTNRPWFCSKLLVIKPGFQSSLHSHTKKVEEFICWDGEVKLDLPAGSIIMRPGDRQLITPGMEHRFSSVGGGILYEISTHHEEADVTRLTQSGRIDEDNQPRPEVGVPSVEQEVLSESVAV